MSTNVATPLATAPALPGAVPAVLAPALAHEAAAALRDALTAMRDLANGWSVEELHKAPRDIDADAQDVLAQLDAAAVTL